MSLVAMERAYEDFQTRGGGADAYPPEVLVGIGGITANLYPQVANQWELWDRVGLHETTHEALVETGRIHANDVEGQDYAIGVPLDEDGNPYTNLHSDLIGLRGLYRSREKLDDFTPGLGLSPQVSHSERTEAIKAKKEVQSRSVFAALIKQEGQKDLATELGVNEQTVSRWVRGETLPDAEATEAVAKHWGVPPEVVTVLAELPVADAAKIAMDELAKVRKDADEIFAIENSELVHSLVARQEAVRQRIQVLIQNLNPRTVALFTQISKLGLEEQEALLGLMEPEEQ